MRVAALVLVGFLAACGQSDPSPKESGKLVAISAPSTTARAPSYSPDPNDPDGCRPAMADLIEAKCTHMVLSADARMQQGSQQRLDGIIAAMTKSTCAAQVKPALEQGDANGMATIAWRGTEEQMVRTCRRMRDPYQYCGSYSCKPGDPAEHVTTGFTMASTTPIVIEQEPADKDGQFRFMFRVYLGNSTVHANRGDGHGVEAKVRFQCERGGTITNAYVRIYDSIYAERYFHPASGADLAPSVGGWKDSAGDWWLWSSIDSDRSQATTDESRSNNALIRQTLEKMRTERSIKIGLLPEVPLADPGDEIGKMLARCWS